MCVDGCSVRHSNPVLISNVCFARHTNERAFLNRNEPKGTFEVLDMSKPLSVHFQPACGLLLVTLFKLCFSDFTSPDHFKIS